MDDLRVNTVGFAALASTIPFPFFSAIAQQAPLGFGNYHAGTVAVHRRTRSLEFEVSYAYTRNLTNVYGSSVGIVGGNTAGATGFADEFGYQLSDPCNPGLDYGNTPFARRRRFLATFLYELPLGKGKAFLNTGNGLIDRIVGGWVLGGIALFQSGPFLTVGTLNDPSGTGYNLSNTFGFGGRADTVRGVDPYAGQSISQWINPNAFADPRDNVGRFGDSQQGAVTGPGAKVVSLSLFKRVSLIEQARLEVGAQVANVLAPCGW